MNREILFRGKSTVTNNWIYGDLYTRGQIAIYANGEKLAVNPDTVGQYTGLQDKYGNKIFEGDIIESGLTIRHEVYFDEMEARYMVACDGNRRFLSGGINQKWIDEFQKEVIGNIHDTPELLKGGEK
jgi:uncharacterized phage protein (TIGR01671 family)